MTPLGEFEVLVLLAVLHLGDEAYPPAVRAEIERRARRAVARGAVYVTLDRLEAKKLLGSRLADGRAPRRRAARAATIAWPRKACAPCDARSTPSSGCASGSSRS